jgi:hypothetical protein
MQLTAAQNLFTAMRGPIFSIFYTDPNEIANEDEHYGALGIRVNYLTLKQ